MCFSAEASFSSSIILGVVGVIAIKKVKVPSQYLFASIPFLFSFQQFAEGILWLSLTHQEFAFLQTLTTYIFLIIAQIIWPTWVPLSIVLLEKNKKRKKILHIILGIGMMLSIYLAYCFSSFPVNAEISSHHIQYNMAFPHIQKHYVWLTGMFYFIPTVVTTFVSSAKRMKILGIAIFISSLLALSFTFKYFISIWCFLASIMSVIVLLVVMKLRKSTKWSGWLDSI